MIIDAMVTGEFEAHGKHLLKEKSMSNPGSDDWNGEVAVLCTHNLAFGSDLPTALSEMSAVAKGSRCRKFLYIANINPDAAGGRELTNEEAEESAELLLELLGFGLDSQWLLVRHEKMERVHFHVVANRVSPTTLRSVHMGWNYFQQEKVARMLEKQFELVPVLGAFADRTRGCDGKFSDNRPARRRRKHKENQQAVRTKITIDQVKADFLWAWQQATSGVSWRECLRERGYELARGDKRDLVVIDWNGGPHSPARPLQIRVAELRRRITDLDISKLPTADEIKKKIATAEKFAEPDELTNDKPPERNSLHGFG